MAKPVKAPFRLAVIRIVVIVIVKEQMMSIMENETPASVIAEANGPFYAVGFKATTDEIVAAKMRAATEVAAAGRYASTPMGTAATGECGRGRYNGTGGNP